MKKVFKIFLKILKWLGIVIGSILLLLIIIILLLRTPWAQQKITDYATSYVSDKTGTEVDIERLFVTFRGNLQLEGLYLEGLNKDTLVYSESLEAGVGISALINGDIAISRVNWQGVRANIVRGNDSTFNFQFLIDSLAGGGSQPADTAAADTASTGPPDISVGPVHLRDIRITYLDSIAGMDTELNLGSLDLTTEETALDSMRFVADELHLRNTRARVLQFKQPPPSEDTSSSPMPHVAWNDIFLENINLEYQTQPDTLVARGQIDTLRLGKSRLALEEQEIFISSLDFHHNNIYVRMPAPKAADTTATAQADTAAAEPFQWPGWEVEVQNLDFSRNNIAFHQGPEPEEPSNVFDPQHLVVEDLRVSIPGLNLADEEARLQLEQLSFREGGPDGFLLRELSFEATVTNSRSSLQNFVLNTRRSSLQTDLQIEYPSLDALMENPLEQAELELNIPSGLLAVQDAYYFQDSLRYNSTIAALEKRPVQISGEIDGHYGDIRIKDLRVEALSNTRFKMNGRITGLPDTNNVQVQIPLISLYTTKNDLANFVDTSTNLNPPQYVSMRTSLRGSVHNLRNEVRLQTPKGDIRLQANLTDILGDRPGYEGELDVENMQLGSILKNPELGLVALEMEFDGEGRNVNDLDLSSEIHFSELEYQNYNYQNLSLEVEVDDGDARVVANHKDENLDMELKVSAVLDTQETVAELNLDLRGADLKDLNFTGRALKMSFVLNSGFSGNPDEFDAYMAMDDIVLIGQDQTSYRSDTVYLGLQNTPDTSSMELMSNTISGHMNSNTSFATSISTMQNFLLKAVGRDTTTVDTVYNDLALDADIKIVDTRMLHDIMLPGLERMDSLTLNLEFKPEKGLLRLDMKVPDLVYNSIEVQGLGLDLDATSDSLGIDFGFDRLLAEPIDMHQTSLSASAGDMEGTAYFEVLNEEEEEVTYLSAGISREDGNRRISLNPDKLILNGGQWDIPESNEIILAENGPVFHDFRLSRNNQELNFESLEEEARLQMNFRNFMLQAVLSIFNAEEPLLAGSMDGSVNLLQLDATPAFAADLSIDSLSAVGTHMGVLHLDADNRTANVYQAELQLKGPQIDLAVNGDYNISGETPNTDLKVNLQKLGLPLIQNFLPEQLKNSSGQLSAEVDISGPTDDITYNGQVNFNQIEVTPTMLGTSFKLTNEKISLDNEGVYFDQFSIADASGDKLRVKGKIGTEEILNPSFDLQINASNFEVLDVTEKNNSLFYGEAIVNLKLDLSGDLAEPVAETRLKLLKPTDVYYAVPVSQASINEREGLVRFANMKDSLDVLSAEEDEMEQSLTGYDINARILADPETRFTILVDPRSNDRITVAGEANLNYHLFPNGNMELVGDYELSSGAYKLSLYELVKKEFNIVKGSRITWNGDPMEANLDITAVYRTRTSPVDLMAERLAGANQATINRYKQQLPFEVMLYIQGTIASPRISFGLSMPDDAKDALGGSVYSQVQQINENENVLNKQVVSLVVFDRFLPSGVASGTEGGGAAGLARSSASGLLTSQLNKLSDRYIEGVELNFDVDSYTDYQTGSAQQRTDLNISLRKSFLDERVVVEVGSQVGVEGRERRSQVLSDVSVEYLLTEDGRWRLKGFQENQYQGVIEGQVRITGLGLLFAREFNNWGDLFGNNEEEDNENEEDSSDSESEQETDTE